MLRSTMARKISDNLNDLAVTYYSNQDLNNSIQDAVDEIVVYSECLDAETELPFQSNLTYYNLTDLIPNFYRLTRIWYSGISQFFEIGSDRREFSYRSDWEIRSGTARTLVIAGPNRIAFDGRTSNPTGVFRIFYKATAPILNDQLHIPINTNYLHLVENYCTADLLEQNEEFIKASKFWAKYEPELEEYKKKIQLLSKSDRVFTRS